MSNLSNLSQTQEYLSFRSNVPLRKITVDSDATKSWRIFDSGPKTITSPLILLPPVSGTADVYYKQLLSLSAKGIRVISCEMPVYWNVKDFCEGFKKLIDHLKLDRVHIFGSALGGYLAQKFAEYTINSDRVASLILCNTFSDTAVFNNHDSAALFWILPALVLKKMIMGNFNSGEADHQTVDSIDFMVERVNYLTHHCYFILIHLCFSLKVSHRQNWQVV